ncbi:MAG TPA: SPOR domain-containing protein [Gemmatimonadales bacterium]|nr:SPOR domain-containing protein [Gemmatimonadales bacterium]
MTPDPRPTGGPRGHRGRWRRVPGLALTLVAGAVTPSLIAQQPDTMRAAALRIAQTRPDSARALMRRLLATLSPQDSLYPGALFTAGMLAPDAATIATALQRVVIEYGRSVWADSALLALTKLYFAQGDPAATVQAAERLRRDYPDSPLRPRAAFTGARAYFELKDDAQGCTLIAEALAGAGADVEFKNQVNYYAARCAPATAASSPPTPSPTAVAGRDSQATPGLAPPTYAVQVLAVKSAGQVDEMLTRLKVMGFDARVLRDTSGLFKVRVGHYTTRDDALKALRRLKTRLGGQPFVVEEP